MFDTQTWSSGMESASAVLISAAWKSSVLLAFAGGLARLLSRRSAAMRRVVWTTALTGSLVIPVLEIVLPAWNVPVPAAIGSVVRAASLREKPASDTSQTPARPVASILAMLERPALKRTVLGHKSANDERNLPLESLPLPSAAGTSISAPKVGWGYPDWLLSAWLMGAVGMVIPLLAGIACLKRLELRSERPRDEALSRQLADVARELGIGRRVTLLLSDTRAIPMTWGTLWPVLLLPREAQNWPASRLRIVLLHELIHVARYDYLFQLAGAAARAIYWFNPLAWWGLRRLKVELEQACDDRVLLLGTLPETYAFELLHITSQFPNPGFTPSAALAIGRSARIQRRIESILDPARSRMPLTRRLAWATALAGLLLTAVLSSVHAARPQADPEPQTAAISAATDLSNTTTAIRQLASQLPASQLPASQLPASQLPASQLPASQLPASQLPASQLAIAAPAGAARTESSIAEASSATQETGRDDAKGPPQNANAANVASDVPAGTPSIRLTEIRMQILKHFVKSPDEKALDEGAIRGMLQALDDPHSEFLSTDRFNDLERAIEGVLSGIGIEVSTTEKQLGIIVPLPGSPAEAAGLKPGDAIVAVDGKTVEELGPAAAISAIRGKAGSAVTLQVKRAGGDEVTLNVTRGTIRMPSVKGLWFEKSTAQWNFWLDQGQKLGYVQISEFGRQTVEDCRSAVKALLDQGLKGLVLDLRHCPGGLLNATVDATGLFLREGTIVSVKGNDTAEVVFRATGHNYLGDFPLLVLIDDRTASAGEILAGALKEHGRAMILGMRTFGKGSVQEILTISGSGAIKLTTAYFYLAGDRSIDRQKGAATWGVDPTDGFYVPVSREQQDQWLRARRKWEITGDALRGRQQETQAIAKAIEGILADPQLAAAYQSLSARVAKGEFMKVGLSEQSLREHLARREKLLKARAEAQKQLETIDKELSATAATVK